MNCKCLKCGYEWTARTDGEPMTCPKCKSREWNQPRRYGTDAKEKREGSWNKGKKWKKGTSAQAKTAS